MRHKYYFTPQGSHLMPYDWFLAIETAGSDQLFSGQGNLEKYGWLWTAEDSSKMNPDGLPIGFTKGLEDVEETGKWMGWTCAACHTGEVVVKKQHYRVDGGPANVDVGRFLGDLAIAVQANLVDPGKFGRFVGRVLGQAPDPERVAALKRQYMLFSTTLLGRTAMRTPTYPAGPGRVDALGQIITAMSVFQLRMPENYQSPDAPVSYPFLWYTPQLAWVQWSPISSNTIGRNAGEVLGVFGEADFIRDERDTAKFAPKVEGQIEFAFLAGNSIPEQLKTGNEVNPHDKIQKQGKSDDGFLGSTVSYKNLYELEQWIDGLSEPRWDEAAFGAIDPKRWTLGRDLFSRDCRGCHNMPPFDKTPAAENIRDKEFIAIKKVPFNSVGTDPVYIQNLTGRLSRTGDLGPVLFEGETVVPAGRFFLGGVAAVVEKGLDDLGLPFEDKLRYSGFRYYKPEAPGEKPKPYRPSSLADLKAGPLLGIWATGPFLHNGSVPNLDQLLSPPESRSKVFWTGSMELDTEKLGFVSEEHPSLFRFDTTIRGNGNGGHKYPDEPYSDAQRRAVIEYLKDPTRPSGN